MFFKVTIFLCSALLLSSCVIKKDECLNVRIIDVQKGQPANVAITVQVLDSCNHNGPVDDLKMSKFTGSRIADRKLITQVQDHLSRREFHAIQRLIDLESKNSTLATPKKFELATLLLLDLSGSVYKDKIKLEYLKKSAVAFVESLFLDSKLSSNFKLAIYTFDGRAELHPVINATSSNSNQASEIIESLSCPDNNYCVDESTNLNGALSAAVSTIAGMSDSNDGNTIVARNIVIFTDGIDRAARMNSVDALGRINEFRASQYSYIHAVGLGKNIDKDFLTKLAGKYFVHARNWENVKNDFQDVAKKITKIANSFYTIQYCSPKRSEDTNFESLFLIKNNAFFFYDFGRARFNYSSKGFDGGCNLEDPRQWEGLVSEPQFNSRVSIPTPIPTPEPTAIPTPSPAPVPNKRSYLICNKTTQFNNIFVATFTNYQDNNVRKWHTLQKDSCQEFSFSRTATIFHYGARAENDEFQWFGTEQDGFPMCIQGDSYYYHPGECPYGYQRYYFRSVVFPTDQNQTQYTLNLTESPEKEANSPAHAH
ncbi:MAG: VWA domain-containing protein [Bdellovibrio sp.]|nr:VWA domain-containing protein [Bdellovibrio sp.]